MIDIHEEISNAIKSFWQKRDEQSSVLAGKQLNAFLNLLSNVAHKAGIPRKYIYLKNNHIPDISEQAKIGIY